MIKKSNTCIAITKNSKGKLMLAGDRRISFGDGCAQTMSWAKVNKKENILLGASGNGDLCSFIVEDGGFKVPERKVKNINTYMFYCFRPAIINSIINFGYKDHNKVLVFPSHYSVDLLIGIEGQAWSMSLGADIDHPTDTVVIERLPSTTHAIGCGGTVALAIMKYELTKTKYLTKQHLKDIFKTVGELVPGCDTNCDIITED